MDFRLGGPFEKGPLYSEKRDVSGKKGTFLAKKGTVQ